MFLILCAEAKSSYEADFDYASASGFAIGDNLYLYVSYSVSCDDGQQGQNDCYVEPDLRPGMVSTIKLNCAIATTLMYFVCQGDLYQVAIDPPASTCSWR